MADLALIFHWALSDMEALDLPELIAWRRRAVDRWNTVNRAE